MGLKNVWILFRSHLTDLDPELVKTYCQNVTELYVPLILSLRRATEFDEEMRREEQERIVMFKGFFNE